MAAENATRQVCEGILLEAISSLAVVDDWSLRNRKCGLVVYKCKLETEQTEAARL